MHRRYDGLATRAAGVLLVSMLLATSAHAQQRRNPCPVRSPAEEAGARAGIDAADQVSFGVLAPLTFIAGLPIGFFGPLMAPEAPWPNVRFGDLAAAAAVGTLVVVAVRQADRATCPVSPWVANPSDTTYRKAYAESYARRVSHRRAKHVAIAGVGGIATGFVIVYTILSGT
jgi:hypothetical protein